MEESLRSQIDLLLKVRDVGIDEAEMGVYKVVVQWCIVLDVSVRADDI